MYQLNDSHTPIIKHPRGFGGTRQADSPDYWTILLKQTFSSQLYNTFSMHPMSFKGTGYLQVLRILPLATVPPQN